MSRHRARRGAELFGARAANGDSLRSAVRGGSMWSIVQQSGSRLTTVIVFLILARLLEPSDFGIVALATVFVALLQVLVEGGFGQALIQRQDVEPGHADTVFWMSVTTAVVLAVGLVAAAGPLGIAFGEAQLTPVLRVLAIALVISALGAAQAALLRRNFRFRSLALRSVVGNVAGGVVGVAAALLGAGVWALALQYLVLCLAQTTLLWFATGWRPGHGASMHHFRELFGFSRNSLGNALLLFVNQKGDDFLVGSWLGSTALGFYSVGYRLISIMQDLVNQTVVTVSLPVFSRLQDDVERLGRAYRAVLRVGMAVSFPAYLFFVVAAPDVILVFFGEKWIAAAPVMQLLALFGAIQTAITITDNCLTASGRPHVTFRIRLVSTLVQVGLIAAATPFGIVWVAASIAARAYLLAPFPVWALRRAGITTFRAYFGSLAAPVGSTVVMVGAQASVATLLDGTTPAARLAILVVVGVVVYTGVVLIVDRGLVREIWTFVRPTRPGGSGPAVDPGERRVSMQEAGQ